MLRMSRAIIIGSLTQLILLFLTSLIEAALGQSLSPLYYLASFISYIATASLASDKKAIACIAVWSISSLVVLTVYSMIFNSSQQFPSISELICNGRNLIYVPLEFILIAAAVYLSRTLSKRNR